jgi:hypothetical protein
MSFFNHNGTVKFIVKRSKCRHYSVKTVKAGVASPFKRTTLKSLLNLVECLLNVKQLQTAKKVEAKQVSRQVLNVVVNVVKSLFKIKVEKNENKALHCL